LLLPPILCCHIIFPTFINNPFGGIQQMEQKSTILLGTEIEYYHAGGGGAPIVFVHGNSASGKTFQKQLESDLAEKYDLYALSLPGHGGSGKVELAQYNMPGYAKFVVSFARELQVEEAIFVGWSLGGHILLEAVSALDKAKGFVIYGTPPIAFPPAMEEAFLPNPAVNVSFMPEVDAEQAAGYAASFMLAGSDVELQPFIADILRTDGTARAGLGASIQPDGYADEVAVVATMTAPLAIFHGVGEQLISGDYIKGLTMPTLWRGAVQMIADAGHAPHWETPELFNQLLDAFAVDVQ
jgi:pimeloyl-ACP methyl ester carboxylesterase